MLWYFDSFIWICYIKVTFACWHTHTHTYLFSKCKPLFAFFTPNFNSLTNPFTRLHNIFTIHSPYSPPPNTPDMPHVLLLQYCLPFKSLCTIIAFHSFLVSRFTVALRFYFRATFDIIASLCHLNVGEMW